MSSSMGRIIIPYIMENNPVMFETTNQIINKAIHRH